MKTRGTTIEELARMVKKGFDETDKKIEKGFKEINTRLDRIETFILKQHSQKIEYLEKRINRLEEALAMK